MSMMDFMAGQDAEQALEDAIRTRDEFTKELKRLDNLIFFLDYYLKTGQALDPEFIDLPGAE